MRTIVIVMCAGVLLAPAIARTQAPADFSGVWDMDPSRSQATAQVVPTIDMVVAIQQSPSEIRIGTTANDIMDTVVYRPYAKEPSGAGEPPPTFQWDGAKLVTAHQVEINKMAVTVNEVHSLNADGTEMTVERTVIVQHGYQARGGPEQLRNTGKERNVFIRRR